MKVFITLLLCFVGITNVFAQNSAQLANKKAPLTATPAVQTNYKFIQNRNQWDSQVLFRATIPNGALFVKQNAVLYSFLDPAATAHQHDHVHNAGEQAHQENLDNQTNHKNQTKPQNQTNHKNQTKPQNQTNHKNQTNHSKGHGVEVEFLGANPQSFISPIGESTENYNYFIGNDQSKWASNLKAYNQLEFQKLYEGIMMRYVATENRLKYEFIVAPQANPKQIQLKYKGATQLNLDKEGNLQIGTSVLDFMEQKPYCYQLIEGEKVEIPSKFVLKDSVVTFELGEYDVAKELVIDPELVFASYSGSNANNFGMSATFDEEGNLYAGGIVFGQNVPPTNGAFDITFNGIQDILILKFNSTGTDVLYATFLGGKDYDNPNSLIVNKAGNLLIMASTSSSDYPTTSNSYDPIYNGDYDIAVSMLNPTGSQLLASTFVGGWGLDGYTHRLKLMYGDEIRGEIDLDANDNVYIASVTSSANFPTVGATGGDASLSGLQDGVVFRLSPNLSALQWSTYIGGDDLEVAYSVAITTTNEVIVAGITQSFDFQVTALAAMPTYQGNIDGFIRRYDATGILLSSTFVGSPNNQIDQLYMMDIDTDNNVYVFGNSTGRHSISPNTYSTTNGGHFMYKFNPTLRNVLWSTKIGSVSSNNMLSPKAFMVSDCGTIYLSGSGIKKEFSYSNENVLGFPTTPDALVTTTTTGDNFYLAMYEKDCKSLKYATFFGSSLGENHTDGGTSRFSKNGTAYQAMCVCNTGLPTTPNAWKREKGIGNCNNAVFKLNVNALAPKFTFIDVATGAEISQPIICLPVTIKLKNDTNLGSTGNYSWNLGSFGTSTAFEPTITLTSVGSYNFTLRIRDAENCINETTKTIKTQEFAPLVSPNVTICQGESTQLNAFGGTVYTWTPATGLSNATISNPIATPTTTTTYKVKINYANRCSKDTAVTVFVLPKANIDFITDDKCSTTVTFTNLSPNNGTFFWDFGNGQTSTLQNPPPINYIIRGNYIVKLSFTSPTTCKTTISKMITINDNFSVSRNSVICRGNRIPLSARGGDTYQWSPTQGIANPTESIIFVTPLQTTTYNVKITRGTCVKDTSVTVTVRPKIATDFTVIVENPYCTTYPLVRIVNNTPNSDQYNYTWTITDLPPQTTRDIAPFRFTSSGLKSIRLTITEGQFPGCDSTITKEINIPVANVNTINPTISQPNRICRGGNTALFAFGGNAYSWTPTTGLDNPNVATPRASPTETTTYTVRISNTVSGCFKDTSLTVNVANPVVPIFTVSQSIDCETMPLITISNNSVHQAGATYLWNFGNGQTSTLQNPPPFRYATNGNYTIRLTTNSQTVCSQTVTNTIAIARNPNGIAGAISSNRTICAGTSTPLQAFGGVSYLWSPSTGLDNTTISNPTASPTETTTYTVKIANNANCFVERKVTVEVLPNASPDFDIVLPQGCVNVPRISLTNKTPHQQGATYLWSFGNGETSNLQNPNPVTYAYEGTYRIKLTINRGTACENAITKNLVIAANGSSFFLTTISESAIVCEEQSTQLFATGGTSYVWTPSRGLSNPNIANPIATPSQTTSYTVTITNGTCRSTAIVTLFVQPRPIPDFEVILSGTNSCDALPLVTIRNKFASLPNMTYFWDFGNGQTSNNMFTTAFRYTKVGTYTISLTLSNGLCSPKFTQIVKIEDSKVTNATISAPQTLCEGSNTQLVATGGTKYVWTPTTGLSNPNIANPIATPTATTRYNVRITNAQGCFKDTAVLLTVINELKPEFELQVTSECGKNGTVKFINRSTGTGEYKWTLSNGEELKTRNPADYDFEKSGEYEIILEMFNGICKKTKSQKVKVETIKPANVITPNNDGKNDRFVLDILNEGWKFEVYNRNGSSVFSSSNYQNDWGSNMESGTYYYLLTSPQGKTCKGWVQVLR